MFHIKSFITLFVLFSLFGCGADRPVWREAVENPGASTSNISIDVDKRGNSIVAAGGGRVLKYNADGELQWDKMLGIYAGGDFVFLPNPGIDDPVDVTADLYHVSHGNIEISWHHLDSQGEEISSASLGVEAGDYIRRGRVQFDEESKEIYTAIKNRAPENQLAGIYRFANGIVERVVSLDDSLRDFYLIDGQFFVLNDQAIQTYTREGELINTFEFAQAGTSESFLDLEGQRFAVGRSLSQAEHEVLVIDLSVGAEISRTVVTGEEIKLLAVNTNGEFYFSQSRSPAFDPDSLVDSSRHDWVTIMGRDGDEVGGFRMWFLDGNEPVQAILTGYDNTLYVHDMKLTATLTDPTNDEWIMRVRSQISQYDENRNLLASYKSGLWSILTRHIRPSGGGLINFPPLIPLSFPILHNAFGVDEQGNVYALGSSILQENSFYVEKFAAKQ